MQLRSDTSKELLDHHELERIQKSRLKKNSAMADPNDFATVMAEMRRMNEENQRLRETTERVEAEMRRMAAERNQPVTTIGGSDKPHTFYHERSPIVVHVLTRANYEIKPQLIQLVEQKQFKGMEHENPLDHIDRFEKLCNISTTEGVPHDYHHCKLFEFSLADKAIAWLNSLPPKSLHGWMIRLFYGLQIKDP